MYIYLSGLRLEKFLRISDLKLDSCKPSCYEPLSAFKKSSSRKIFIKFSNSQEIAFSSQNPNKMQRNVPNLYHIGVFLALGCSGIIPIIHMMAIYGIQRGSQQGAVGWLIVMGLCYIIGAILYALRVPERFFPGKCNLVVSSYC